MRATVGPQEPVGQSEPSARYRPKGRKHKFFANKIFLPEDGSIFHMFREMCSLLLPNRTFDFLNTVSLYLSSPFIIQEQLHRVTLLFLLVPHQTSFPNSLRIPPSVSNFLGVSLRWHLDEAVSRNLIAFFYLCELRSISTYNICLRAAPDSKVQCSSHLTPPLLSTASCTYATWFHPFGDGRICFITCALQLGFCETLF